MTRGIWSLGETRVCSVKCRQTAHDAHMRKVANIAMVVRRPALAKLEAAPAETCTTAQADLNAVVLVSDGLVVAVDGVQSLL